jgi:hypothetical protein
MLWLLGSFLVLKRPTVTIFYVTCSPRELNLQLSRAAGMLTTVVTEIAAHTVPA